MSDVLGLVLPFFGLIFLGFFVARVTRQPLSALGWMNTFIVYVALPALFFQLVARTPFAQLAEWTFILGAVASTYLVFVSMFAASLLIQRSSIAEATIKSLASAYGNIGYMGPGLALLAFGPEAAVPVALVFCFENIVHFALAPTLMALSGGDRRPLADVALDAARKISLHPFILSTAAGVLATYLHLQPPVPLERLLEYLSGAAAPCALFTMGVTLALRPLKRVPAELAPIAFLKLILHPLVCYVVLSWIGDFSPVWLFSAVLLASLPTATNVFVLAQQYHIWVERASASILLTTCFSVATVTCLLYLIKSGFLPPDLFP
jgi:hypothetical protein